jgi:hypothetical protein
MYLKAQRVSSLDRHGNGADFRHADLVHEFR